MTTDLFIPPAAEGLPIAALDSATEGADRLDAAALTPTGRNFLAHALVQLARDGWLRAEPDEGFEPVRDRKELTEPAAAPVAAPPTGPAELQERIAEVIHDDLTTHGARRDLGLLGIVPRLTDAVLAVLPADSEPHRLALSTALGLGTGAPWDAIRERAAELAGQDVAADLAALSDADRKFLTFALDLAADQMASRGDEFNADDEDAMERLRRLAAETPGPDTQSAVLAAALDGLHTLIATSSRDWGQYRVDAWLWAVLVGWDCEEQHEHDELCDNGAAMAEMQRMHGWDDEAVAKARRYRAAVCATTPPAVVAEPGKENDSDRIVAYRSDSGRLIHCLQHVPPPAARHADFHPVTPEDLPDGGICTYQECGVDVLAQQPKEA